MVFGDNFDKLLWLMLAGDKKNREKIASFIKIIPQKLYDQIQEEIARCREMVISNNKGIKRRFMISDGFVYEFEFDVITGDLNLSLCKWKNWRLMERFRLTLSANTVNILNNMKNFETIYVGSFSCDEKIMSGNDDQKSDFVYLNEDYYLVKTPIGYIVDCSDVYDLRIRMVGYSKKCPSEMYVSDFSTPDKVEQLVKRRKITNRRFATFIK